MARARRLRPAGVDGVRCNRSRSARSVAVTVIGTTRLAMSALLEHAMAYINSTSVKDHKPPPERIRPRKNAPRNRRTLVGALSGGFLAAPLPGEAHRRPPRLAEQGNVECDLLAQRRKQRAGMEELVVAE